MLESSREQVDEELRDRLRWLVVLRWIAVGVTVTGALVASLTPRLGYNPVYVLCVAVGLGLANAVILLGLRRLPTARTRRLQLFVKTQIAIDLGALSVLIHVSDGIYSPFVPYFVFHMIIASILLQPRDSYEAATVATICIAVVYFLSGQVARDDHKALLIVLATATMLYSAVYLCTSIMTSFRAQAAETRRLAMELGRRAEELRRANEEIDETRRLETRYMRKVAHELRSPLSATIASLQVITKGVAGELTEKQAQLVGRAEVRARQLLKTVDDLLALIRTRAPQRPEVSGETVSVKHTIESVAQLLEARAESKSVAMEFHIQDDLPMVRGDQETLIQVCTNLVSNAVKYTLEGGSVDVSAWCENGTVVMKVADTGIGIPEEDQGKVFEEFFRSRNAREYADVGTGLGLAIAKSAAEALGGSLEFESEVGVGTAFTLRLPALVASEAEPQTA